MDEQQHNPASEPDTVSDSSPAESPGAPQSAQPSPAVPRRRRPGLRLVGSVAATAVVAGALGVGGGLALSRNVSASVAIGPRTETTDGQLPNGRSRQSVTIPGFGSWSWNGQGQGSGGSGGSGGSNDPFQGMPGDPGSGFGGFGGGFGSGQGSAQAQSTKASGSQLTGLVRIASTMKYAGAAGAGTGMILSSSGEVVTNHHVVEGSTTVKATVMSTGKTYTAKVVGTDAKDDVAVLQLVGASGLSTVKTDTDGVSNGDAVTAVGDGNGTVGYLSAAKGKVLAQNQSLSTQSEGTAAGERLTGMTKISSDVVPGYSGGATYDAQGEVIGMTTAASSGGSDITGYAIPISKVLRIAGDLQSGVTSSRYVYDRPAFLGVGLSPNGTGTTVAGVYRGLPAAKAGIKAGDRITAIGSTQVRTAKQLHDLVAAKSPGDHVSVTWVDTAGASHTATVTLTSGGVS